jgi:hypothetical protein
MRGFLGVLVGLVLFAIGLAGLGVALNEMMTHADPNSSVRALAGLGTFVVVCLVSMVMFRY